MDEQAAGSTALGIVVLALASLVAGTLLNRAGVAPLWVGLGISIITAATVVVALGARRR